MTISKKTTVAGENLTKPKATTAKGVATSALTQQGKTVTAKSGAAISRSVTTHRDALKRLANR